MAIKFAGDAKKDCAHDLEHTFQRRVWPVSIASSCESSFFEQNRLIAAAVQRYTATLTCAKMSLDDLKLLAKLDEMVVEMLEHMYFQDTVTELEIT